MRRSLLITVLVCSALLLRAQNPDQELKAKFRVRYVSASGVYVEGGKNQGLSEGVQLVLRQSTTPPPEGTPDASLEPGVVARLVVVSVASSSAVCEVVQSAREIAVGDILTLPAEEVARLVEKHSLMSTRRYPIVVSFSEGDPLEEEVRAEVPKPPLPEINRMTGRIGFDFSHSSGFVTSSQGGAVVRANITRIGGTYWNLSGYWRGRANSVKSKAQQETIQDLRNRMYHMSLTYSNPQSKWVMGAGRLYIPWASSLQTIDGGYFGRRLSEGTTAALFAGMTPDPTSWNYDPHRTIAGTLINFEGGDYERWHYTSTTGAGLSAHKLKVDRPLVFVENDVSFSHKFSIYHSAQFDKPRSYIATDRQSAAAEVPKVGAGLSNSYLTVRIEPSKVISFDVNHTFFRDVPTFDSQLLGFGLLDKLLFQGFSAGTRVKLPRNITVYSSLGRSDRSYDLKASWNALIGASTDVWRTGIRMDGRYARFNSSYASGSYESVSFRRKFNDASGWEIQVGRQAFASTTTVPRNATHFVDARIDMNVGSSYFVEGGVTAQRGGGSGYNQIYSTFGWRFDNRLKKGGVNAARP